MMKKITFLFAILIAFSINAQVASTSFEEPAVFTVQYVDTGDANVAHDLADNADEPVVNYTSTGGEIGFSSRYVPYDTPSNGLTDGDFVGVTDFAATVGAYTDGDKGFQISDADGNYILEFDEVDLTGASSPTVSLDLFIPDEGFEGDGTVNEEGSDRIRVYINDVTNSTEIDLLDSTGTDINDLTEVTLGQWNNLSANLAANSTVQLVVEVRCNAGAEAFYFDNIVFGGELSTSSFNQERFSVYPNPASDFVTIASQITGVKSVAIFDVLGKEVLNTTVANERLNISALNSGVYVLRITQDGISETKKLVVR